jgi:hypothetical protein
MGSLVLVLLKDIWVKVAQKVIPNSPVRFECEKISPSRVKRGLLSEKTFERVE